MAPVLAVSLPRSLVSCVKYGKNHTRLCWGLNNNNSTRSVVWVGGVRQKSSPATASLVGEENTTDASSPMDTTTTSQKPKDSLDLTFCDHESAFKSKTTAEIMRALMVFRMCGIKMLVDNNEKVGVAGNLSRRPLCIRTCVCVCFNIYITIVATHTPTNSSGS